MLREKQCVCDSMSVYVKDKDKTVSLSKEEPTNLQQQKTKLNNF